ncbi:MAG: ATP-binding protein [Acidobacteriota bacterium]
MIKQFSQLFKQIDRAVLLLSMQGEVYAANPTASQLFAKQATLVGSSLISFAGEEIKALFPTLAERLVLDKRMVVYCCLPISDKMKPVWQLTFSLVEDEQEPLILLLIESIATTNSAKIITLAAQARERESNSNEFDMLFHTASHDLKAPLLTMFGFTRALKEDYGQQLETRGKEYIEHIVRGANRLESMVLALLDFLRISHCANIYSSVPFNEILQEACAMLKSLIAERQAKISVTTDLPTVFCDRARIIDVMVNLLSNAIKYTSPEQLPEIEIGCCERGRENEFWVRDHGIGVDPKFHTKIFEIFYRTKELRTVDGTGVGLALVRKIIALHGGSVRVESTRGTGSCFFFTLPVELS